MRPTSLLYELRFCRMEMALAEDHRLRLLILILETPSMHGLHPRMEKSGSIRTWTILR